MDPKLQSKQIYIKLGAAMLMIKRDSVEPLPTLKELRRAYEKVIIELYGSFRKGATVLGISRKTLHRRYPKVNKVL